MAERTQKSHWWRPLLAGICIALAAASLIGTLVARYVQRNILDTEGYLAIVGPLPQNPQIAGALADFTTEKIFSTADTKSAIKEFLPPRLSPLADPLAEQLEKRVNQRTQEFVQSDGFNPIWLTANRLMQQSVVRVAQSKQGERKMAALGTLNLSGLVSSARQRLGSEQAPPTGQQQEKLGRIRINLHQRVDRLRTVYRAVNTGAYVLPYLAGALLLLALAVAYDHRRTMIAIGVTVLLLGITLLLTFKIFSGGMLDEIAKPANKAAAEVIYQAFYSGLRDRLATAITLGGAVIVLALLAGPYAWARWLRATLGLDRLKRLEPHRWATTIRAWTARYELWFALAGVTATLIWLLALPALTAATLVVILSLLTIYVSLLHLVARPSPSFTAG